MTTAFDIVRAMPEQAPILTGITLAAKRHWGYPEKWIELWTPELTFSPEYVTENEMWAASVNKTLAGYYSFKQDGEGWWLENLWILPEFMGNGLGRLLFTHALEKSRARGVSILKIEADPHAQGFYERMGAKKVSEHRYELDGQLRILPIMEINV